MEISPFKTKKSVQKIKSICNGESETTRNELIVSSFSYISENNQISSIQMNETTDITKMLHFSIISK